MNHSRTNLVRQAESNEVIQFPIYNLTTLDKTLGKILFDAREKVGLTQEELATAAGISKPYVGTIENMRPHTDTGATPKPGRDKIISIVKALNEKLPAGEKLNLDKLLMMVGHAPENSFPRKPMNVLELFETLEFLGLDVQFDGGLKTLESLDADDLQELLDGIVANASAKVKRKMQGK